MAWDLENRPHSSPRNARNGSIGTPSSAPRVGAYRLGAKTVVPVPKRQPARTGFGGPHLRLRQVWRGGQCAPETKAPKEGGGCAPWGRALPTRVLCFVRGSESESTPREREQARASADRTVGARGPCKWYFGRINCNTRSPLRRALESRCSCFLPLQRCA